MTRPSPRIAIRTACLLTAACIVAVGLPAHAQQIALPVPGSQRLPETTPAGTPPPAYNDPSPSRAGNAAVSATVSMDVLDDSRPLSRGDIVNLRIVEDRDPPVSLQITDAGDLEVPYIGRVRAEGKNPRALAFEIKSMLERDYYHQATVILALDMAGQRSPGRIYVTGAVNGAGPQEIPANERFTVSKAILRAGGFSDFANQRKIKVTRAKPDGTTEAFTVDVKEVIEKGRQDLDIEVLPNDFIVVPERLINF
jgi:protein involved in polysaccharide export with SLBB domain